MSTETLTAVSPIDGRYHLQTKTLSPFFSEYALIHYRLKVEVFYLVALLKLESIQKNLKEPIPEASIILSVLDSFNQQAALAVKDIEKTTNHDVKAVEYYLKEQLLLKGVSASICNLIHFGCTSEDINNLAYALMLKDARHHIMKGALCALVTPMKDLIREYKGLAMLSRTHGQSATPSTLGKEIANFYVRLENAKNTLFSTPIKAKLNGAVGNFNAHHIACPDVNWPEFSQSFILSLDLEYAAFTTQIEPHDFIAELNHAFIRLNTILIDMSRDIWQYISMDYFKLKVKTGEVGSSTMPHKVNPIDFENAEGNLGIANALFDHLALKLPISRLQRDLSDSTVLRNLGVAFSHSLIAYQSLIKGLNKLDVNIHAISQDLNNHPEVLAEAVQTVMRLANIENPYEKLKDFTRGQAITFDSLQAFIASLDLAEHEKSALSNLKPDSYLGFASTLCDSIKL